MSVPFPRRHFVLGASSMLAACVTPSRAPQSDWQGASSILRAITPPRIPARTTLITAHGAALGTDTRPAILAAIEAASQSGGGRVVIPEGLWLCDGPIHLRSRVNLHLARGAQLRFSPNPQSYLPAVLTRWEGTDCYNYSPFIYAYEQTDVAVTGPGTIDGQGASHWLPWRREQRSDQQRLRDMGRDGAPVANRMFGDGHKLRPHFIQFHSCERVLVDGPTLIDSPFWLIHPLYCSDVIVRNITAISRHLNSDGVDIDSSHRVLVERCDFDVGDDGVAIKSGRDQDGWRVNRPSEDIVIRNCRYSGDAGGGVSIGSEMSGGVRNVFIERWTIPKSHHGLYFKANLDRGGLITDIHIRDIDIGETDTALIFTNAYHSYRGGQFPPRFERVHVQRVRCAKARVAIHIQGDPQAPVRDVRINTFETDEALIPLEAQHVEQLQLDDVRVNRQRITLADALPPAAITP